MELLSIQPGVTPTGEVLGARRDQNNVTLDGSTPTTTRIRNQLYDCNDHQWLECQRCSGRSRLQRGFPVPLDSVQEFRVTVGGQGADAGRSSGGQVTLITRAAATHITDLFTSSIATALAANNWFSNRAGVERETLVRNQFGGAVGGRIIRDRAFFFRNYEQRIDASAQARTRNVPTEALKQGMLTFRAQ